MIACSSDRCGGWHRSYGAQEMCASSTACRTALHALAADAARGTVRLQSGRIANYALTMIGGLVLFASSPAVRGWPMNVLGFPLLSLITFLPLVGAAIILSVRGDEQTVASNARWTALWTSLITLALSLVLWFRFDTGTAEFQFVERVAWFPELGVGYHMGVDGISVLFVLLSAFLTPLVHPRLLGKRHHPRARLHGGLPRPRDDDGRHVLRAGLPAVLYLL